MKGLVRGPRCLLSASVVAVAFATGTLGAAQRGLPSTWRTEPVAIDGMPSEWPKLELLPRGPEIGVTNDDQFIYFLVSSGEEVVRDLLATGLILWLDPNGGKAQTFGIWAPGVTLRPLPGASPVVADSPGSGISAKTLDQFDLLGPGKNQRRLVDVTPAMGIELASATDEKRVMYEVRIPLAKTAERPYAVGAAPGKTVGVGVATPEAPRDRGGRRDVLVGSSGTIGGSPWQGGGFAPYRERPESIKPLDIWTTVKLATK